METVENCWIISFHSKLKTTRKNIIFTYYLIKEKEWSKIPLYSVLPCVLNMLPPAFMFSCDNAFPINT